MRVLLLPIIAWIATATIARAECDCLWQGSFVEVQSRADLVVSGTVAAGKGNSIDLAIERPLRGGRAAGPRCQGRARSPGLGPRFRG